MPSMYFPWPIPPYKSMAWVFDLVFDVELGLWGAKGTILLACAHKKSPPLTTMTSPDNRVMNSLSRRIHAS